MNSRFAVLCALFAFAIGPVVLHAESGANEAAAAASVLVLGRAPTPAELSQVSANDASIGHQIAALMQRVRSDSGLQRDVARKAWTDALGRMPSSEESAGESGSYTQLLQQHVAWLGAHGDEYAQVIRRVYPLVIHREVYPEEIAYWKKFPAIPFVLLVGCVENWARRNQPGLMVTAGAPTMSIHSEYLVTARLSPTAAAEARDALGLKAESAPNVNAPNSADRQPHHLVAAGGESIATDGGMYFAAAGGPDLVK